MVSHTVELGIKLEAERENSSSKYSKCVIASNYWHFNLKLINRLCCNLIVILRVG